MHGQILPKNGDPGIEWPLCATKSRKFLNIGLEIQIQKDSVDPKRVTFWNVLVPNVSKLAHECKDLPKKGRCHIPYVTHNDCNN